MKKSKVILALVCAVLLVCASVLGTLAYLTSSDTVTNTFTVGQVKITLDEAKVDGNGKALTGEKADRVKENTYKLMPGHAYDKDPTVHVDKASEHSYIFVKVENGLADVEAATVTGGYTNIAGQIASNGWTALDGVENVYYREYAPATTPTSDTDYVVFEDFKIADNANDIPVKNPDGSTKVDADREPITIWSEIGSSATITVTAYAVQKDGFTSAKAAWDATFGA